MYRRNFHAFLFLLLFVSCSVAYRPSSVQYKQYRIDKAVPVDSSLVKLLSPYANNINATMNKVIGMAADSYTTGRPESALGNFLADCYKEMAAQKFNRRVDAAFMNAGGIRSYFSKGNITMGKVFEIMPFDNLLVLQELKGSVLQLYLDKMAEDGGWPVSKGCSFIIRNKKATQVIIDGKPLDRDKTYIVAHSDYIANGGSDCDMLKPIPQSNVGYLMRDAIIEYIQLFTQKGQVIAPVIENRVSNAN